MVSSSLLSAFAAAALIQTTLCLQLGETKTENLAFEQKRDVPPPIEACNAESSVFTVDPRPSPSNVSLRRVLAAGIMSSGSTWLRLLLEEASGKSSCAVYSGEGCYIEELDAYCRKGSMPDCAASDTDKYYVKTHWPQHGWDSASPDKWLQLGGASFADIARNIQSEVQKLRLGDVEDMRFSKLLLVVRHPLAQMASFSTRWGGTITSGGAFDVADGLYCWSSWWARVIEKLPSENVHVVKYEDLCENTDEQVDSLLNFFDYPRVVTGHSFSLDCLEERSLELATQQFEDVQPGLAAELTERLQPVMKLWGYA